MSYDYRNHLKNSLTSRLGADNAGELMIAFSIVEDQHGTDKALDITLEAAQRLLYQATASAGLPLNRNAQLIADELERVNKNHGKNLNKKKILADKVALFNSALSNAQVSIVHNGRTIEIPQSEFDKCKIEIPQMLKERDLEYQAYAASKSSRKITELTVDISFK